MKQTLIALALALPLMACSDAQTQSAPQEDGIGSEITAGVAGAAVGALAMNALSNNNHSSGYEVERCDSDDHPNEPECRGTTKYYKWKKEQDAKKKAVIARKSYSYKTKRKPR